MDNPSFNPTNGLQRLESLDVIRGLAILGILVMNIQAFGLPEAAYSNPMAWGDFSGLNAWVWAIGHVLVDAKFMSMFAMLFGAGIGLFCDRLAQKQMQVLSVHSRRMFWLALFGLLHAHLVWWGDILFSYAVCGIVFYPARNLSIRQLWIAGSSLIFVAFALIAVAQLTLPFMPDDQWQNYIRDWQPEPAIMADEIASMTGTWMEQFRLRTDRAVMMETYALAVLIIWQAGGLMLFGMALYKEGLFQGRLNDTVVLRRSIVFLSSGFALVLCGLYYNASHSWSPETSMLGGSLFNYVGSALVALGYVHSMVWLVQANRWPGLRQGLAYVGRMAFSNYIAQSLICTLIFYGFGFSLYGQLERWQLLIVVFCVWALQWVWSAWWLKRFRYGPLEWCWRRLTYWHPLNLRSSGN